MLTNIRTRDIQHANTNGIKDAAGMASVLRVMEREGGISSQVKNLSGSRLSGRRPRIQDGMDKIRVVIHKNERTKQTIRVTNCHDIVA